MKKTRYQHRVALKPANGLSITRPVELVGGTISENKEKLIALAKIWMKNGGFVSYKIMY